MKNHLRKMLNVALLFSLIILSSCEKDLYEDTIKNSSEKIKVKDVSLSSLDIETAKRINQKIATLKSEVNKKGEGKFEYNSSFGFYIDTEDGKQVVKDGKLFYTFPMFRESEDNLENVVFTTKSNGELEAFLVKYDITPEEYLNIANTENITTEYEKFGGGQLCVDIITTTTVYPNCEYPDGLHPNGVRCNGQTIVTSVEFCSNDGGGGNDTGGNSSSDTNNTGISNPTILGGGPSTIDEIITVTTPLSQQQINIRDFILSLNEDQSDWYFGQEPEVTNNVINYLICNNFSEESENYISEVINAVIQNNLQFENNQSNQNLIAQFLESVLNCDGDPEATSNDDGTTLPPDCASFNFTSPSSTINWQQSAVVNIHFTVLVGTPSGVFVNHVIDYPTPILFGMPKNLAVGNTNISPGLAATLSAAALNKAIKETVNKYGNKNVSYLIVEKYFESRLKHNFEIGIPGARLNLHPQSYPTPTQYQTNASGLGDCQ